MEENKIILHSNICLHLMGLYNARAAILFAAIFYSFKAENCVSNSSFEWMKDKMMYEN